MPYSTPSAAQFRARFPEFTASDPDIDAVIAAAMLWVDVGQWDEGDYQPAILYLAAHYLKLSQDAALAAIPGATGSSGSSESTTTSTDIDTFLQSVQIGDRKVTWGKLGTQSTSRSGVGGVGTLQGKVTSDLILGRTLYGLEYIRLRRRNIIPILVV